MNTDDPNVAMLGIVAEHLGDALRAQLVFVGGAVAGLLVTDPASPSIRPTEDVDLVCSALALADYYRLGAQLRERGFMEDARPGAPAPISSASRIAGIRSRSKPRSVWYCPANRRFAS